MRIQGMKSSDFDRRLNDLLRNRALPLKSPEGERKDIISHFALRLAYCKPYDFCLGVGLTSPAGMIAGGSLSRKWLC